MFSSKLLVYLKKPNQYTQRRMVTDESRKQILKLLMDTQSTPPISRHNLIYQKANQLVKAEKMNEFQKYQNSFWFAPSFTPTKWRNYFIIPTLIGIAILLYVRYVANPRYLVGLKEKLGVRFHDLQSRGYLDGWYQGQIKKDEVLKFEAYTLEDMERLYKDGLLAQTREQTVKKIQKKNSKFVRGDKNFVLKEFKTN